MKLLAAILIASVLLLGCVQAPGGAQATEKPIDEIIKEDIATPTPKASSTPKPTATVEPTAEATAGAGPSPAASVTVQPSVTTVPIAGMQEFTVEIDDDGWYPNAITVKKGIAVKLTMKMRNENVYFAGVDLKSNVFNELGVKAGETRVREFTPESTFKVSNYWPSQGVFKGDLTINVE